MNQDLKQNIKFFEIVKPSTITADTDGTGMDLQGFNSAAVAVSVGAPGDTLSASVKMDYKLEHSTDNSTFTAVTSNTDVTGGTVDSNGIFTTVDADGEADTVYGIGYVGPNRYIRVVIDVTGSHSTGTAHSVVGIAGNPIHGPVADQT